jgi:hypothetical protein
LSFLRKRGGKIANKVNLDHFEEKQNEKINGVSHKEDFHEAGAVYDKKTTD